MGRSRSAKEDRNTPVVHSNCSSAKMMGWRGYACYVHCHDDCSSHVGTRAQYHRIQNVQYVDDVILVAARDQERVLAFAGSP